jgi:diketogulonate reductase-like aldo/keto reductase
MRFTRIAGQQVPVLGQGTWQMGDSRAHRPQEIAALQAGIDLGLTLIDTAEMYGNGASEELVADAIEGRRDRVFLVTKVLPGNATSAKKITAACEQSLRRLRVSHVDLYLLHWRQSENLEVVVDAFSGLVRSGKIRHWGVSNFDVDDLEELRGVTGAETVASNQVLYNVTRRGIEFELLPQARAKALNIMAYSPIERGRIVGDATLQRIAARHDVTPAQIALAWTIRQDGVVAIPKASTETHVRDNARAVDLVLSPQDLADIDRAFPAPARRQPLEMI